MLATVLFPTNFTAYANTVFACLPDLKSTGLRVVVLVRVIDNRDVPMPSTINREDLKRVQWSVQERLHMARMALEGQGLRVTTRMEYGSPSTQILRVAEEERIDLIVIGTQGKTLEQEFWLGSVAYEVVRRSSVPVLMEKAQVVREIGHVECRRRCEQMFTRVLYPTDFSECADAAFQVVKRLKSAGTQEVIVLHVQDKRVMKHRSSDQISAFGQQDLERLEAVCRALRWYGIQARPLLRFST